MRTMIVAEIGANHEGSLDLALRTVDAAKRAGCDAVKFQHYSAERIAARDSALYWDGPEASQREAFAKSHLTDSDFERAFEHARGIGLEPFSTPFDLDAVDGLERLGVERYKIASGDITYLDLLRKVADQGKPVYLSTGASTLSEVGKAVRTIERRGNKNIVVMGCTLSYPTPVDEANLRQLTLLKALGYPIGLSDHTESTLVPALAVALGACVIEKHFTFDRNATGSPDHKLSMDPRMMRQLVENVREAEKALRLYGKPVLPCEKAARIGARRSLAAAVNIPRMTPIMPEMLTALRPATGIARGVRTT